MANPKDNGNPVWVGVFLVTVGLYVLTAQRTVSWQDSGEFQYRVQQLDLVGTMGLARAHPLYILSGWAVTAPIEAGHPWMLNAFSGVGLAVAVATFAATVHRMARSIWVPFLIAALLAVCHTAWWLGTIAEVYTWSLAVLAGELYLLTRLLQTHEPKFLLLLALLNGVGFTLHNFALLGAPVYLAVTLYLLSKGELAWRAIPGVVVAWLIGASLMLGLIVAEIAASGDVASAVRSAMVGDYGDQVFNVAKASKNARENWALVAMNLINPLLPLAVIGWASLFRRLGKPLGIALMTITAIHGVFFLRYSVPDQFTFFLPTLLLIALSAGVGLDQLVNRGKRWRMIAITICGLFVIVQPVFFERAPRLAERFVGPPPRRQPYRQEYRYWLIPWKYNETSARQMVDAVDALTPPTAVILTDGTAFYPLAWKQSANRSNRTILAGDRQVGPPLDAPRRRFTTRPEKYPSAEPIPFALLYGP